MSNRISPRAALLAFAVALVILAQGISAPFVKDAEPQAASWIQDVAGGSHLLIPRDYYGELARTPPLFYWMAGAITAATGGRVTEVRARVVSVIAGAAVAVAVLTWSAALLDLTTGWLAFLFLLGSFAFTSRGTLALEDMTLVAFMFAAWCMLYRALEETPSRRRIVALGITLGLGILTEGPVAIVLPALGAAIYLLTARRSIIAQIRKPWPWMVLAIAVAVALLWYIPALMSNGGELAKIMLGHFLGAGRTDAAARPFYHIAMRMIGGITPLNVLLPALVVALIGGDFVAAARKPLLFQLSLLLAMLIFFSLASARRDDYVLAGLPSLAILFAALFTSLKDAQDDAKVSRRLRDIAAAVVIAIAILGIAGASMWIYIRHSTLLDAINPLDRAQADLFVKFYIGALSLILVVVAMAVAGCAELVVHGEWRGRPAQTAAGLGALSLLGVLMITASVRPEMARERTLKYAAADINRMAQMARMAPEAKIYVIHENEELSFYLGREAPVIIGAHGAIRSVEAPAYLFAYRTDFRGPAASLHARSKLIQQWDRLGKAGSPALYQLDPAMTPDGLKGDPMQAK